MPKIYRMKTGSMNSGRTIAAMSAYHDAKRRGKKTWIVAKDEKEKLRLCVNHGVDPADVILKADVEKTSQILRPGIQ